MKTIFWDFDGVILDSMAVRDFGFEQIFKAYEKSEVDALLHFHRINGGLSRYVKIRYFFNEILNSEISDEEVLNYASRFSDIMKKELIKKENLITETVNYIKSNYDKYNFHIVSGSDQEELRFLCKELGVAQYFLTINGSPTHKNILVSRILETYNYSKSKCCLIGDSINDLDAANHNKISFFGFNNQELNKNDLSYIENFSKFYF
ncbi:HAD family hydrolase [Pseudotamlana haliotis]|uniref:HAD family hydrolase n=1 Tax=Pseudotamlana haliotis TaxID=2614804 RepID=UPI001CD9D5D2|nr:HAD hydrolase-like protein [Tamlana haliotis]